MGHWSPLLLSPMWPWVGVGASHHFACPRSEAGGRGGRSAGLSWEPTRLSHARGPAWHGELDGVSEASARAQWHPGEAAEGKRRLHKSRRLTGSSGYGA